MGGAAGLGDPGFDCRLLQRRRVPQPWLLRSSLCTYRDFDRHESRRRASDRKGSRGSGRTAAVAAIAARLGASLTRAFHDAETAMLIEALRLLEPFFDPSTVLTVAIIAALTFTWLGRWRLALAFQMVATAIVIALGILPGATWLALPLEERFQRNPPLPDHVAGIIALGGTERVGTSEAWGQ